MGSPHCHTGDRLAQGHIPGASVPFAVVGKGPVGDFSSFSPKLVKWSFCDTIERFRILDLASLCEKGLKDIRTFNS